MNYKATYSPEDNKLRLYPAARLSAEEYQRVKSAGFKWAPKQELFVAPMWTPSREDLLLEMCGEIEDEDTSLAQRTEERAERFEQYRDNRQQDAERARKSVSAIADQIPFGQPILVGHHSERHARRDAKKIENGMRRAVRMWETSKYWEQRAADAIRSAKYKELPSVRARRIKTIEADKRKQERVKTEADNLIRFWEGKLMAKNPKTGEKRAIEITEENRAFLGDLLGKMSACGVMIRGIDGQSWYSAWDILRPEEERYKNCPTKTVAELQEIALRLQAKVVARCHRWLAHYENRLTYERAMLAADGGTATDRKAPEKDGACKCWASHRGGFSYIVKVNKVSVTVLDNWGNTNADGSPTRNFTRTIPFDKLSAIMSASEVETARREKRLVEYPDKTGFALISAPPVSDNPVVQKLIHASESLADAPFDAMKESLRAGGVQVVSAPQLFPTPPELAKRVVDLADIKPGHSVLEPSAGTGALYKAVIADAGNSPDLLRIVCVESNASLCETLKSLRGPGSLRHEVNCADFLSLNGELGEFDRIVMNPPFADGDDIKHIRHAFGKLKAGGRLVAICANGPRQQRELKTWAEDMGGTYEPLERGAFAESGTNVNAALIVVDRDTFSLS